MSIDEILADIENLDIVKLYSAINNEDILDMKDINTTY